MLLFSIHYFLQITLGFRGQGADVGAVFNIMFYTPISFIITLSIINMESTTNNVLRYCLRGAAAYALIVIVFVCGVIQNGSLRIGSLLYVMLALFVASMAYFIYSIRDEIQKRKKKLLEESATDLMPYVRYAQTSLTLLYIITRDASAQGYYEHGAVAFEGTKIVEVGEEAMLRAKYPDAEIIDAKGGVIMPAFINAHTHIYSALARGLSIVGNNPTNFYEVLDGTWWAIDRHLMMDGTHASATALYIDSIKQGVTTIFDHHASYGEIPGTLHTIAEESKRLGLRSCLCYEVSDRDGEEKCLQAIQENADFITECEKNKDPMLAAMFGGHALFTISDKTFDRMVAANNGRTGYHIHVSEGMNDVYDSLQNYGRRPVQRLQDHGILGPKTILGHCIHVNTAEMEIIKETGTMVVNNPESNMGNAIGICPVLQLHKRGILLGMGTDAYTNDMLESLKVALCSQRSQNCLPNVGWCEVTDMLFKNNAKIGEKYFPDTLGVLKPGAAADIIVMDYKPFTPFSDENIDGHMIFGMTGRQCQTTIAAGKTLMLDRELVGIDEEAENAHILEAAKKLWGELNHRTY